MERALIFLVEVSVLTVALTELRRISGGEKRLFGEETYEVIRISL